MYFVCLSRTKTIRKMYTKYSSMISSLFINNLLSSLCFCRCHSESTPYNISSSLSELFLIECRRSGGDCFVGHEVGWFVCSYRLERSLAIDPVRTLWNFAIGVNLNFIFVWVGSYRLVPTFPFQCVVTSVAGLLRHFFIIVIIIVFGLRHARFPILDDF